MLVLPPKVAWFYVRAHRLARRNRDQFSLVAPMRPRDLAQLLRLARGRYSVVELGTGTAWTAAALAIAHPTLVIDTFDPVAHPSRGEYLDLAGPRARARIRVHDRAAEEGPPDGAPAVDLLFIDIGGHSRTDTVAAFLAWEAALAPQAVVAFHDYTPAFPGVPMAVAQLRLDGDKRGESVYVARLPQPSRRVTQPGG